MVILIDYKNVHEGDLYMSFPLIILAVFSIFFGYISRDVFVGLGTDLFSDNSIFIHPIHEIVIETEFGTPTLYKILPLFITISLFIAYISYSERKYNINNSNNSLRKGSKYNSIMYIYQKIYILFSVKDYLLNYFTIDLYQV